jgi:hypothetical protein
MLEITATLWKPRTRPTWRSKRSARRWHRTWCPNGFNRRVLLTANHAQPDTLHPPCVQHQRPLLCTPRCPRIAEQVAEVTPELQPYLGRNENETALTIEKTHFYLVGTKDNYDH